MSSPDVTPYVDLTLYDKDPQDIFALAVQMLQIRLPGWTPREGNTEVLLLESLALQVAELVYAINRLPDAITEVLLKMYEVERDAGAPPETTLTFNMAGTQGYTIPAGTSVLLDMGEGLEPITFVTLVELTIPPGSASGTTDAVGQTYTDAANGILAGTEVELLDSVFYVESVALGTNIFNGRDPEDDAAYFTRGVQRLSRLVDTLVLPRHFVSAALEEPYVIRATALDNYNPANDPDNNGPVGNDGGYIAVAAYGDMANLTAPQKSALDAKLQALSLASLTVNVIDPTITPVNVTATIVLDKGYVGADVVTNVVAALNEFLSRENWDWSSTVRKNELIQVIGNAEGVAYVNSITTPANDQTLQGVAPLTTPGTLNITVV